MTPCRQRPPLSMPIVRLTTAATPPATRMKVSFGSHAPSENCQTGLELSRMLPCERCICHQIVYSSDTWEAGGLVRSKMKPDGNSSFIRVASRNIGEDVDV